MPHKKRCRPTTAPQNQTINSAFCIPHSAFKKRCRQPTAPQNSNNFAFCTLHFALRRRRLIPHSAFKKRSSRNKATNRNPSVRLRLPPPFSKGGLENAKIASLAKGRGTAEGGGGIVPQKRGCHPTTASPNSIHSAFKSWTSSNRRVSLRETSRILHSAFLITHYKVRKRTCRVCFANIAHYAIIGAVRVLRLMR